MHACPQLLLVAIQVWMQFCFALLQERTRELPSAPVKGADPQPSLLSAVFTTYGWPYLALGLLKLGGDALNFAGGSWRTACSGATKPLPDQVLGPACWSFRSKYKAGSAYSTVPCAFVSAAALAAVPGFRLFQASRQLNAISLCAGPLLLNQLILYLQADAEPEAPPEDTAAAAGNLQPSILQNWGYVCAGALGLTSVLKVRVHALACTQQAAAAHSAVLECLQLQRTACGICTRSLAGGHAQLIF